MNHWHKGIVGIALALATGCALAGGTADYVTNSAEIVKQTDWDKMQTVVVELTEHDYTPGTLTFTKGQPYKLVLKNIGEKKHYFTAPEFYKAIATRKVQSDKDGEVKVPYLLALEMMAKGGQLDLYFVPVVAGEYPVYCTIDDHREQGMEGKLIIR
ncbi:MAG TPA: cupredoxin domain-containing protein [Gammaproteobacteria bacterium]